jgi:hypothetical protein
MLVKYKFIISGFIKFVKEFKIYLKVDLDPKIKFSLCMRVQCNKSAVYSKFHQTLSKDLNYIHKILDRLLYKTASEVI